MISQTLLRSLLFLLFVLPGLVVPLTASPAPDHWATDAVWYQIFPERFRNGDPSNDPTRDSLEKPIVPSENWHTTPWTADWYARDLWEEELGPDFFEHGVFHRRFGGDLQGVIDKLDYLQELGITAIYFNPLFHARSLHKYDASSFHHIDPHFGPDPEGDFALMAQETNDPATWQWTSADLLFLDLIQQARQLGIRVIIDGVFNHTGREFWAFRDIRVNQQNSPYADWYNVVRWNDPRTRRNDFEYEGWWGHLSLPVFARSPGKDNLHPGPKEHVFNITRRWMAPDGDVSRGVDGWRLDVVKDVPVGFWREWNAFVREINPEAYTVAEIWYDARETVAEGGFSAAMNFHGFAIPVKGYFIDNTISPSDFAQLLQERKDSMSPKMAFTNQNLIDCHDTDRVASMIVNRRGREYRNPTWFDYDEMSSVSPRRSDIYDVRKPNEEERDIQKLITLFQMTYLGAPMVYYGTEAGMWGADDPCDRKPMVWADLDYDPEKRDPRGQSREPDTVEFDHGLFDFYRSAIALRNKHAALRRGDFRLVAALDEENVLAYARELDDEKVLVVVNRSREPRNVDLQAVTEARRGSIAKLFYTRGEPDELPGKWVEGTLQVELPGLSGGVFLLRR